MTWQPSEYPSSPPSAPALQVQGSVSRRQSPAGCGDTELMSPNVPGSIPAAARTVPRGCNKSREDLLSITPSRGFQFRQSHGSRALTQLSGTASLPGFNTYRNPLLSELLQQSTADVVR